MNPKLKMLERQLAKTTTTAQPAATVKEPSSLLFDAMTQAIEEQASARIEAAKEQQHRAEAETVELRKEIARLQKEITAQQKESHTKMEAMRGMHKGEMERCCSRYEGEMQKLKDEAKSLRQELAGEQQARVKAESQMEAAKRMQQQTEQLVAKLKTNQPAPVIQQQPAAPPKPLTAKVTQRDGNGRIVTMTISPST